MNDFDKPIADQRHIPALDGVRGIAIAMVLLTHFGVVFDRSGSIQGNILHVLYWGGLGVDLFFVLSGFLITGILLDSVKSGTYFSTFYMRRILRIFPLYYFFLFFLYVIRRPLSIWLWGYDSMPGVDLRWHLLYLSNWKPDRGMFPDEATHLWSLAIEEQFYLVWPLMVFLVPRRFLGYVCLMGIACAVGLRQVLVLRHSWDEMIHRWTPVRMDTLLMGALMALAYRDPRWRVIVGRALGPVSAVFFAWFLVDNMGWLAITRHPVMSTLRWSVPAVVFSCLVFWAATAGRQSGFLTSRPMLSFGRYSYGIYMWHLLAIRAVPMKGFEGSSIPVKFAYMLVLTLVACGFAALSWNLLEQPFLRLKRLFPYRQARSPSPALEGLPSVAEVS